MSITIYEIPQEIITFISNKLSVTDRSALICTTKVYTDSLSKTWLDYLENNLSVKIIKLLALTFVPNRNFAKTHEKYFNVKDETLWTQYTQSWQKLVDLKLETLFEEFNDNGVEINCVQFILRYHFYGDDDYDVADLISLEPNSETPTKFKEHLDINFKRVSTNLVEGDVYDRIRRILLTVPIIDIEVIRDGVPKLKLDLRDKRTVSKYPDHYYY